MRPFTLAEAASAPLASPGAQSQSAGPKTSAVAMVCDPGIGMPARLRFQLSVDAPPAGDKGRLNKRCKPNGEARRIATVRGTAMGHAMKVRAATITWHT